MDVSHLLRQTVTLYAAGAPTSSGDPTYGAGVSVAARVQPTTQMVMSRDGTPTRATHIVYMAQKPSITDRHVVPGSSVPRVPIRVDEEVELTTGVSRYWKVVL